MKNFNLLILLFVCTSFSFGQAKIKIESGKSFSENQLGIDKFYFVHQTFADAFYMTDLYKQLTDDEMFSILEKVYYSITKDEKVLVIVEQEETPAARLGFEIFMDTKIGDILVLGTNFNQETLTFEKEIDQTKSIYRWYMMNKGKLVYRKDLYSKEAEEENRQKNSYSLIGMYLFDDNFENDSKAKPLIDELLASDKDDLEKLYGYLYEGEYWLMNNNFIKAEKSIQNLENLLAESETIPQGYSLILKMAKTEYEMMKRFGS